MTTQKKTTKHRSFTAMNIDSYQEFSSSIVENVPKMITCVSIIEKFAYLEAFLALGTCFFAFYGFQRIDPCLETFFFESKSVISSELEL